MLQVTVNLNLLTPYSIWMGLANYDTNYGVPEHVLSYWADTFCMLQANVTLTFNLLTQKSLGVIFWSWPTKTLIMVFLSFIGFKLMSGQRFYAPDLRALDLWPTGP